MATAATPDVLVREAEQALAAAQVAAQFAADNPDLPIARMHACSTLDYLDAVGEPLLAVDLEQDVAALTAWAKKAGLEVDDNDGDFKVITEIGDVVIWVVAWDYGEEPDVTSSKAL